MEIDFSRVVLSTLNFIILYLILKRYFFKPINNVIETREKGISDRISKTKEDSLAAEQLRLERENYLRHIEDEGIKIIENYKNDADKLSKEIVLTAKEEAEQILEKARYDIQLQEQKLKEDIKCEVVELAVVFAEKALARNLDEAMHQNLINDFIDKVDNQNV